MPGHELRNPLAPILTAVELLGRHSVGAREREVIDRNARHLARLVDDLLDISRVTRGHVELRNERITLASVLQRAAEIAGPLIARHEHTLDIASAEDVTLLGDPVRLAQVFGNLLTNAAKFTPPGGRIEVAVERQAQRVRVTVRDNGRGLERDQLPRVDGYELARMVRTDYGKTPTLIAATGYGQQTDRQRAASAGFDFHFVKPVDVQDIARVLDRVIGSES
jgi:signal transduction histidine kinase